MVTVSHVAVLVLAALLYASLLRGDVVGSQDLPSTVALHPEVEELLVRVAQLRSNGELEGLLELLSEAEGINPNHPAVAKEFALTYEQLGQPDEAQKHWKRIMAAGETAGGTFFEMAKQRLPIGGSEGKLNRIPTAEPADFWNRLSIKTGKDVLAGSNDQGEQVSVLDAQPTRAAYTRHPWRTDIVSRVFWIGGKTTGSQSSAWDANWMANYGGFDDPDPAQRTAEFTSKGFTPGLNPFYVALPYNDCLSYEQHKPEAAKIIPWFKTSFVKPGRSVLRGTWLAIRYGDKVCYAQWEDCGPFQDNDSDYVFGTARPLNREQNGAAIDLSPAVRDYLNLTSGEKVDWRFVDVGEVPGGPWSKLGMNNHFVRIKELRDRQQHLTVGQSEELRRQRSVPFSNRDTSSAQPLVGPSSVTLVQSSKRVALVIGNSAYSELPQSMQLSSPKNDATDVAAALQAIGYTLINGGPIMDASRDAITTATEQFATAARDAEAAVFYFSGHGIQVGDDNYLLPSDTPKLNGLSMLKNRAVLLRDSVMVALEEAGAASKVIILDCCRDNPFSAQLETALAQVGKSIKTKSVGEITGYGPGFYLAFATSPGQTAADGNGARNSPFTAAMLQALPGGAAKDIDFYFREVKAKLPRDQVSWTNHSLSTTFSLAPGGEGGTGGMVVTPPVPTQPDTLKIEQRTEGGSVLDQGAVCKAIQVKLPGDVLIKFGYCPPGSFIMGSPASEVDRSDDEDQVQVRISKGFWMGQTEVTQGQWATLMGTTPEQQKAKGVSSGDVNGVGEEHPMYFVNWEDAQAFLSKLNQSVPLPAGWKYALPTEAQWEYACRAGTESVFSFGDTLNGTQANCDGNSPYGTTQKGPSMEETVKAGSYAPNAWGLYDMHGNVYEWCQDVWDGSSKLPGGTDPLGTVGSYRVLRGGSWVGVAQGCRAADRLRGTPDGRVCILGFRVAAVPAGAR